MPTQLFKPLDILRNFWRPQAGAHDCGFTAASYGCLLELELQVIAPK
jgi:hypothetical protein